ncbi:MAG: TolC family protein [Opitutales bacterium]|nr:TolC family protein [Opitutales bacterium]
MKKIFLAFPLCLISTILSAAPVALVSEPSANAGSKDVPASRARRAFELPEITAEDVAKVVRPGTLLALEEAIPQALRKNLGLAVGRVEKSIVEETPEIAEAEFDPKFSFSSVYDTSGSAPYWKNNDTRTSVQGWNNSAELSKKFSFGTEAKVYGNFNRGYNLNTGPYSADSSVAAGVSLKQPLMKGFGETVNLAPLVIARQNVLKSGLSLRKATLDLIYDTEVAYWNLSASYALVSARLSSLRHAESVLEQVQKKRRLKSGRSATLEDVLQAEAEVASRRVNLVRARQSVENCDDAIRKLLGEKGDEDEALVYRVAELEETPENRETRSFGEWISAVRVFDIDLQIKEIDREQAALNRVVAEDADLPSLDLVLGAEVGGRESAPWDAVRGAYAENRRGYDLSAGIQFSVPIGFRASEAQLRQAMKRQQNVEIEAAQALQNAMFEARSAWRSLEAARERLAAARIALNMQNESFKGQRARYSLGEATLTDVLSAQDSLDAARLEEIQAQLDVAVARAKTARLDGRILSENGFTWEEIDYGNESEQGAF